MAEPKKRHTSTRSGNRRSHLARKKISLQKCSKCNEEIKPHMVCKNCGYYGNEDILHLAQKEKEKEERRKKREEDNK